MNTKETDTMTTETATPPEALRIAECSLLLSQLTESAFNPRKRFNAKNLEELAESIAVHGIAQPLLVRRKGEHFEIIAGARRFRGATIVANRNGGGTPFHVSCPR